MQWFLHRTQSASGCLFLITDGTLFVWLLITAAPSYACKRQSFRLSPWSESNLSIWFSITFAVGLLWIWLKSRNVSQMTRTTILWSIFKYFIHNNKISLLEYLSVTLSAIIENYFVSSTIFLNLIGTNFEMQALASLWIFAEPIFAFFFLFFWSVFT